MPATLGGSILILLLIFSCSNTDKRIEIQKQDGMVLIPQADFMMGGDELTRPDELPRHKVVLDEFWMDETEVTNAQFLKFVGDTGYVTTAERKPDWKELKKQLPEGTPKPDEELLVPGSLVFTPPNQEVPLNNIAFWWSWVPTLASS
jgi:sulfatase modifying factor 1